MNTSDPDRVPLSEIARQMRAQRGEPEPAPALSSPPTPPWQIRVGATIVLFLVFIVVKIVVNRFGDQREPNDDLPVAKPPTIEFVKANAIKSEDIEEAFREALRKTEVKHPSNLRPPPSSGK
jgi:hypothetical protein